MATQDVAIEERPRYGRCLVAKRAFKAGEALVQGEKPFVAVVTDAHLEQACSGCLRPAASPLRCSSCKVLRYCSQACQRSDWAVHRAECAGFKKTHPSVPPTTVRLLCRVLYRRAKDPGEYEACIEPMAAHRDEFPSGSIGNFAALAMAARSIIPPESNLLLPTADAMLLLGCRMALNTMDMGLAVGLFGMLSAANHACLPNAALTFGPGGAARLVAVRDIASKGQLTISYVDMFASRVRRRDALSEGYRFECECALCGPNVMINVPGTDTTIPPPQRADDHRNTLLCTKGRMGAKDVVGTAASSKHLCAGTWNESQVGAACNVCNLADEDGRRETLEQVDELTRAVLNLELRQACDNPDKIRDEAAKLLSRILQRLAPSHSLAIRMRNVLMEASIALRKFKPVLKLGEEQLAAYRAILGNDLGPWPFVSTVRADMFKAALWELDSDLPRALALGREAIESVRITHGDEHPLYKEMEEGLEDVQREIHARKAFAEQEAEQQQLRMISPRDL